MLQNIFNPKQITIACDRGVWDYDLPTRTFIYIVQVINF